MIAAFVVSFQQRSNYGPQFNRIDITQLTMLKMQFHLIIFSIWLALIEQFAPPTKKKEEEEEETGQTCVLCPSFKGIMQKYGLPARWNSCMRAPLKKQNKAKHVSAGKSISLRLLGQWGLCNVCTARAYWLSHQLVLESMGLRWSVNYISYTSPKAMSFELRLVSYLVALPSCPVEHGVC